MATEVGFDRSSTAPSRKRMQRLERSGGNPQVRFAKRTKQSNRRSHLWAQRVTPIQVASNQSVDARDC